jgi:F-type H+-transporting ATPase subunit b
LSSNHYEQRIRKELALSGLGINLGYLLVQILNFAVLFVVIYAWAVKPIIGLLENRREAIAQGLEDARIAEEARSNAEREADRIIAEAQKEAAEIVREASDRAEKQALQIRAEVEGEIVKIREAAMAEMDQERERALSDLRSQVVNLAIAAAQKLIGESLMQNEEYHHTLLQEFFSGVKSGNVVVLEGEKINGASAEVTSALPLTPEEQETIKSDILSSMGQQGTISFRVDPSILGGLIIRAGDQVINGSIAGQLRELRQAM